MASFTPGDRIRNRISDEIGTVDGSTDCWGNLGVIYDGGKYFVSAHRLELAETVIELEAWRRPDGRWEIAA